MELFVLSLLLFASYIIVWLLKRKDKQKLLHRYGIPGPKPHLLSGNIFDIRSKDNPNEVYTSWLKKYGKIIGFYFGDKPQILINDINIIKHLFIKESRIFVNRPKMVLDAWPLNETLLDQKDENWKRIRSILTPTFSAIKIKKMTEIMNRKADTLLNVIEKFADKDQIFDMYKLVQGLTLDIIGECVLALKVRCQEDENDPLLVSVRDFFKYSNNIAVMTVIMFPPMKFILEMINKYLTSGRMTSITVNNIKRVIKHRRKHPEKKAIDLLQLMLDSSEDNGSSSNGNRYLTDSEIIANAYVFLLAGYETTATALAFTFYLLATHQDVQERLYSTLLTQLHGKLHPSYEDIQNIQYLDQVFNESLRYYPPVTGFISRECCKEYKIDDLTIPKGVIVNASIWDIHHDPEHWNDPWIFDPDRFSSENKQDISAFFPFGLGPRACIGMRFAQIESKLIISRVILNYKLITCEETDVPLTISCPIVIINPKNGVRIKAERRCS